MKDILDDFNQILLDISVWQKRRLWDFNFYFLRDENYCIRLPNIPLAAPGFTKNTRVSEVEMGRRDIPLSIHSSKRAFQTAPVGRSTVNWEYFRLNAFGAIKSNRGDKER